MNFKKLQTMQAKLDEAILADKALMTDEERFNKTLVALSVEISEIANCAEHFKFWKDNKGKFESGRFVKVGILKGGHFLLNDTRNGNVISVDQAHRLTLIEECSDALHFILSLANQLDYEITGIGKIFNLHRNTDSMEVNYLFLSKVIGNMENDPFDYDLEAIIDTFFIYVRQLGITEQELEQAYYDKNKINYERLENGY